MAHPLSPPHAEKINEATRNLNNFVMLKLNRTKILKYKVFSFEFLADLNRSYLQVKILQHWEKQVCLNKKVLYQR